VHVLVIIVMIDNMHGEKLKKKNTSFCLNSSNHMAKIRLFPKLHQKAKTIFHEVFFFMMNLNISKDLSGLTLCSVKDSSASRSM